MGDGRTTLVGQRPPSVGAEAAAKRPARDSPTSPQVGRRLFGAGQFHKEPGVDEVAELPCVRHPAGLMMPDALAVFEQQCKVP